jgi:hypothetical protein
MEFPISVLFLLIPLIVGIIVITIVMRRVRAGSLERLTETLRKDASLRGWTVNSEYRGQRRAIRWTGAGDGVQWSAESVERSGSGSRRERTEITRWQTTALRGPSAPILLMGIPKGVEMPQVASAGDGLLANLAMKAVMFALDKGIDVYFGLEAGQAIDAKTLQRVDTVESHVPGYAVMAGNPAEASRLIAGKVGEAVRATVSAGDGSSDDDRRPWVLIWREGVIVSRPESITSAAELDKLIRAGLAIAKAVRW